MVNLAFDRSFGQNAGRLLERCRRNKRLRLQACLGDTQQNRCRFCRTAAFFLGLGVYGFKLVGVNLFAYEEGRIARSGNFDLAQHLRNDDFDMLVADLNTLGAVNVLNFLNQVFGQLFDAQNAQNIVRSERTFNQHIALLDHVAVLNRQTFALRNQVFVFLVVVGANHNALFRLVVLAEFDHAVNVGDNRRVFRAAGFKQLGHARQTAGNVF